MPDSSTHARSPPEQLSSPADAPADAAPGRLGLAVWAALLYSVMTSAIAFIVLPAQLRLHWSLGLGPQYGPTTAPAHLVLGVFPLLVAGCALVAHALAVRTNEISKSARARQVYESAVIAVLGGLALGQTGLVVANLLAA